MIKSVCFLNFKSLELLLSLIVLFKNNTYIILNNNNNNNNNNNKFITIITTGPGAQSVSTRTDVLITIMTVQRFRRNRGLTAAQHPLAACAAIIEHAFF
jgi:hypothetical protein